MNCVYNMFNVMYIECTFKNITVYINIVSTSKTKC